MKPPSQSINRQNRTSKQKNIIIIIIIIITIIIMNPSLSNRSDHFKPLKNRDEN